MKLIKNEKGLVSLLLVPAMVFLVVGGGMMAQKHNSEQRRLEEKHNLEMKLLEMELIAQSSDTESNLYRLNLGSIERCFEILDNANQSDSSVVRKIATKASCEKQFLVIPKNIQFDLDEVGKLNEFMNELVN